MELNTVETKIIEKKEIINLNVSNINTEINSFNSIKPLELTIDNKTETDLEDNKVNQTNENINSGSSTSRNNHERIDLDSSSGKESYEDSSESSESDYDEREEVRKILGEDYPNDYTEEQNQEILENVVSIGLRLSMEKASRFASVIRQFLMKPVKHNSRDASLLAEIIIFRLIKLVQSRPEDFSNSKFNFVLLSGLTSSYFFLYTLIIGKVIKFKYLYTNQVEGNSTVSEQTKSDITISDQTNGTNNEIVNVVAEPMLPPHYGIIIGAIASLVQRINRDVGKFKEIDKNK